MATLTDADVMALLDKGTNPLGALQPQIRARLFAAIDNPTERTWDDAHGIIVRAENCQTLWQAVLVHTDYPVVAKGENVPWPIIPTREQVTAALTAALEDQS